MLADGSGAAGAPGHNICTLIEPAILPAFLEEFPDHVVVFVGEGEIRTAQFLQTQTNLYSRLNTDSTLN